MSKKYSERWKNDTISIFLGLENYSKIEKCLSTYIKDNFKNLSSVIYKDSEYLIYQRLDF